MAFAKNIGFEVLNLDFSPIKGPEGNIEYLMHIKKLDSEQKAEIELEQNDVLSLIEREKIQAVVAKAHQNLD